MCVMCCFVFQQEWLFRAIQQWCVPVKRIVIIVHKNDFKIQIQCYAHTNISGCPH